MTDAETEPPKSSHARAVAAYTGRLQAQGFTQIKLWVPKELRDRFYAEAAQARAMKKAMTA